MKSSGQLDWQNTAFGVEAQPHIQICPICVGTAARCFQVHGFWIRECVACGHRFAEVPATPDHVQHVYNDGYFNDGGAGYPRYVDQASIVEATGRYYARLMRRFTEPGTVLDVGAAAGFLLKAFTGAGWNGVGIEPNASMAAYARSKLGLDVRHAMLEQFSTASRFHLVTMIQVISHFWDLRRALDVASVLTLPGGFWLVETWNRLSWTARVLGKNWHEYSPPSVLHWFSPEGLARLAGQYGFREVSRGKRLKWILGKHAVSLLDYKLQGTPAGKVASMAGKLVPRQVPYPSEDLFWILLRKSA